MQAAQILAPQPERQVLYQFAEYAKFKPHSVIIHKRFINTTNTQENTKSLANLDNRNEYNGYLSDGSRRKVKGIIENFLTAVQLNCSLEFPESFPSLEVYPTFLTLTLPSKQMHCDNVIKKECFFRFMEYLQGEKENSLSGWNVKNFIWVSETQKNGNIHFHVILDRAIPADRLGRVWNRYLERLGYVTDYRNTQQYIYQDGFKVRKGMLDMALIQARKHCKATGQKFVRAEWVKKESKRQLQAYTNGMAANWQNPPSSKIHAIRDIKKLTAYVSKYMTKEPIPVLTLPQGETLEKRPNGYYAVGVEKSTIYCPTYHPDGRITDGLEVIETPYEMKVSVKFDTRRLRGRIWGASKDLHTEAIAPLQIVLEMNEKHRITTRNVHVRNRNVWREKTDLFGQKNYDRHVIQEEYVTYDETEYWLEPIQDIDAKKYVDDLRFAVSAADRQKATERAGPMFASYGEIIPLSTPQKDLLPSISPPMWERYRAHYKSMFSMLYHEAA
jgi:hypothetical protein